MSTEFTVGLEGGRNSSKVLKPPGGGSSDIFGLGSTVPDPAKEQIKAGNQTTKSRLFGQEQQSVQTPQKIVGHVPSPVSARKQIRRNPITGEGLEYAEDKAAKDTIVPDKETEEKCVKDSSVSEKASDQPKADIPKVVQTSIRVRNPPGGKSSGIF